MSYTYTTYKLALRTLMVSSASDVNFDNILPSCIDYAEQRIYRELDLLQTVQVDTTVTTLLNTRTVTIPNTFIVVNNVNIFLPVGTSASAGSRKPLTPVSRDVVDLLWPGGGEAGEPTMFAMTNQWTMALGPPPNGAYAMEIVGTYRPTPLSDANPTTFLTDRLPDLFMAASMIFMSMYMRNFASAQGQSGNDPLMSGNWEAQYEALFKSADTEEARKMFAAASWTSRPVSPQAQPQRG